MFLPRILNNLEFSRSMISLPPGQNKIALHGERGISGPPDSAASQVAVADAFPTRRIVAPSCPRLSRLHHHRLRSRDRTAAVLLHTLGCHRVAHTPRRTTYGRRACPHDTPEHERPRTRLRRVAGTEAKSTAGRRACSPDRTHAKRNIASQLAALTPRLQNSSSSGRLALRSRSMTTSGASPTHDSPFSAARRLPTTGFSSISS